MLAVAVFAVLVLRNRTAKRGEEPSPAARGSDAKGDVSARQTPIVRQRIGFEYLPADPMLHGWRRAPYSVQMDANPTFSPMIVGSEVRLKMTVNDVFAMDHDIEKPAQPARRIRFSAKYTGNTMLYFGFSLRKDDLEEVRWVKIEHGRSRPPEINKEWPTEYVFWIEGESEPDGWTRFDVRADELLRQTWQNHAYELRALTTVRLRGSLCISPILFFAT